jgi:CheY-like chemotaxis protein
MIADDDRGFLQVTKEYLERNGYHVLCTLDPVEARQRLEDTPMAVALIDIRFDEADAEDERGLTLAEETIDSTAVPKIIITQYHNTARYAVRALRHLKGGKSPAVNFFIKNDGPEKLLKLIKETISRVRVFLSYTGPDRAAVLALYTKLEAVGMIPWMDKKNIPVGMAWEVAVERAINETDFFVVCLSPNSVDHRGYFQKEIKMAIDLAERRLEDDVYLIPARLAECEIRHQTLQKHQWVDLFEPDGFQQLVEGIRQGIDQRHRAE